MFVGFLFVDFFYDSLNFFLDRFRDERTKLVLICTQIGETQQFRQVVADTSSFYSGNMFTYRYKTLQHTPQYIGTLATTCRMNP